MALTLGDNFSYGGSKPLDARLKYATLADMKAVADATMYDGCLAYCVATDKTYQWKSTNTVDTDTGKWREFSSGGGSSVSPYTSNPAMNGTASAGVSDNYSRGDHVHPSDTSKLGTSGDGSNVTAAFTTASSRANISTGEKLSVIFGKIAKFLGDLKTVAFSGSYNDLSNKLTAGTNIAISADNVISTTSTYTMRYSTSEQVVGTWIDGRPLYQKVVIIQDPSQWSNTAPYRLLIDKSNFPNIKEFIDYKVRVVNDTSESSMVLYFKYPGVDNAISIRYSYDDNGLCIDSESDRRTFKVILIVQYTKTTD